MIGGFAAQNAGGTKVAVTAETMQVVEGIDGVETTDVADRAEAEELVTAGDVDAAIVPDTAASGSFDYVVIANDSPPEQRS